jgi:hypothetical protein
VRCIGAARSKPRVLNVTSFIEVDAMQTWSNSGRSRRLAAMGSLVAAAVVACCGACAPSHHGGQAEGPATPQLNWVSAADVVSAIAGAGLAVPNARDVTQRDCPQIDCASKVETDTVTVTKFPTPGKAAIYAATLKRLFQIEDVVVTFSAAVTPEQQGQYENAVRRALG